MDPEEMRGRLEKCLDSVSILQHRINMNLVGIGILSASSQGESPRVIKEMMGLFRIVGDDYLALGSQCRNVANMIEPQLDEIIAKEEEDDDGQ